MKTNIPLLNPSNNSSSNKIIIISSISKPQSNGYHTILYNLCYSKESADEFYNVSRENIIIFVLTKLEELNECFCECISILGIDKILLDSYILLVLKKA